MELGLADRQLCLDTVWVMQEMEVEVADSLTMI